MSDNINVKTNPITTIPGILLTIVGILMYCIEYILPVFFTLKEKMQYAWWQPLGVLGVGILFLYMSDKIFERIFNRADKVVGRYSHTEDTTVTKTTTDTKQE